MRGVGETQRVGGDAASAIQHSLFILSPRDRDGLSQAAQAIGWRAIGARRPRDAPQRFLRSEAQIALIDLRRGGDPDALLAPLVPAMEAGGGALILLLDDAEEARVPALLAAGATHYLLAPFTPDGLRAVLASAQRLVERLGGEQGARQRAQRIRRGDALYWQLGSDGLLRVSEALARHLALDAPTLTPAALMRQLPRAERAGVLTALRAMARTGRTACPTGRATGWSIICGSRMGRSRRMSNGCPTSMSGTAAAATI